MLTFLAAAVISLPDATLMRPERLLQPTELVIDAGVGFAGSAETKTPLGAVIADEHYETTVRVRAQVGILKFLTASVTVPLLDLFVWQNQGLGSVRFGDPTLALYVGPAFQKVHAAAFAELTFPTSTRIVLRPYDPALVLSNRGSVVTTGGIAANFGAFVYGAIERENVTIRLSARAAYRLRTEEASHAIFGDLRFELVVAKHLLLGLDANVLIPFFGLETSLISPSRLADSAGWIDAGLRFGWRFSRNVDLSAAFFAPLYTRAGPYAWTGMLVATFTAGPW